MPFNHSTIAKINDEALASVDRAIGLASVGNKTSSTGARCTYIKEPEALEVAVRTLKRELKFDARRMGEYLDMYPDLLDYQPGEIKPLGEMVEEAIIGKMRWALTDRIVDKCLEQYQDVTLGRVFANLEEPYLIVSGHISEASARKVKTAITTLEDDPTHKNVLSLMYALSTYAAEAEAAADKLSNQGFAVEGTQLYQAAREIEELNEFFSLHLAKEGFDEILSKTAGYSR